MTTTETTPDRETSPERVKRLQDQLQLQGDALDTLTITELRLANSALSRQLGRSVDVAHAITNPTEDRWDALAYVAWLQAKRHNHQAKLAEFMALTAAELSAVVQPPPPPVPVPEDDDDQEADPITLDDVEEAARQDPTDPTP